MTTRSDLTFATAGDLATFIAEHAHGTVQLRSVEQVCTRYSLVRDDNGELTLDGIEEQTIESTLRDTAVCTSCPAELDLVIGLFS